jgi:hypothetical protein
MRLKAGIVAAAGLASLLVLALVGPAEAYRSSAGGTSTSVAPVPYAHPPFTTTPTSTATSSGVSSASITRTTFFVNGRRTTIASVAPALSGEGADVSYVILNGSSGQMPVAAIEPQAINDDAWAPRMVVVKTGSSSAPMLTSVSSVWNAVLSGRAVVMSLRVPMGTMDSAPNVGHVDGGRFL